MTIQPTTIVITRHEGPSTGAFTFRSWEEANDHLAKAGPTFPCGGAYDKHFVEVMFADGAKFAWRLDCQHPSTKSSWLHAAGHYVEYMRREAGDLAEDLASKMKARASAGERGIAFRTTLNKYNFGVRI